MSAIRLQLVVPFHQSIHATVDDIEQMYRQCYLPWLEALEKHEGVQATLYVSGHLLDYFARNREDYLMRLKKLARASRIEVLGGLFYGGFPSLLPELDIRGQVEMNREYWESFLGQSPKGFWLSELSWTAELPRLFQDTELSYGFVSNSQLSSHGDAALATGLGVVERGGERLGAFILDHKLSASLTTSEPNHWLDALADRAGSRRDALVSVWVRGEVWSQNETTRSVDAWLAALASGRSSVKTVLPRDVVNTIQPVMALTLREGAAAEVRATLPDGANIADWNDFHRHVGEANVLYRRMLRVSEKLRDAVATMEDDELEDEWSDSLATAQRLVFAAQAPDAYYTGEREGFLDPTIRDAVYERIIRAEALIDALTQPEEDWLCAEEEDRDSDGVVEMFVANRHLAAWVVPTEGGRLLSLEHRALQHNVLDLGGGREVDQFGLRAWLLPGGGTIEALAQSTAPNPAMQPTLWRVVDNSIDEAGDYSYNLHVAAELDALSKDAGGYSVQHWLSIPIDRTEIEFSYQLEVRHSAPKPLLWALEVPLRVKGGLQHLRLDGKDVKRDGQSNLGTGIELRLEGRSGETVILRCEPGLSLFWQPRAPLKGSKAPTHPLEGGTVWASLQGNRDAGGRLTLQIVAPRKG